MSKIAVIYWSSTGNTQMMAESIAEGAKADLFEVSAFKSSIDEFDKVAFGCPSMGAEELESDDFEPFFTEIEASLKDKKVALFGSYGWGDGEWMRTWEERTKDAGANVFETLILNETPDDDGLAECESFGKRFAEF